MSVSYKSEQTTSKKERCRLCSKWERQYLKMKEEIYTFVVMMFDIVYLLLLQFLNPVIIIFTAENKSPILRP